MAIDQFLIASIRSRFNEYESEQLIAIWSDNDRSQWSDETFVAISEILLSRGIRPPTQHRGIERSNDVKKYARQISLRSAFWLNTVLPLFIVGGFAGAVPFENSAFAMSLQLIVGIAAMCWTISGVTLVWKSSKYYEGLSLWKYAAIFFSGVWCINAVIYVALVIYWILKNNGIL